MAQGTVVRVSGPVVVAEGLEGAKMFDVVRTGELGLIGEVIRLEGNKVTIQVYEDTTGIRPGDKVENTKQPLSVELGPGLLTSIYDGVQRPLNILRSKSGDFISRGIIIPALDEKKKWDFVAVKKKGDKIEEGDILGEVQETPLIKHKVMLPLGLRGELVELRSGSYTIRDAIGVVQTGQGKEDIFLATKWTVRIPRPFKRKLPPETPLITGQRVLDTFFPVAKGGTAAIPGPFGSGKCVLGNTPVYLADGSVVEISEIYNRYRNFGRVDRREYEEIVTLDFDLKLFSYKDGRIIESSTRTLYKGMSDSVISIKTASGRSVNVTPSHKLFSMDGIGRMSNIEARYLAKGMKLVAVGKIPTNCSNISKLTGILESAERDPTGRLVIKAESTRARREISLLLLSHGIAYSFDDATYDIYIQSSSFVQNKTSKEQSLLLQQHSWVFADEIVEVKEIAGPHVVYDFSLPDFEENFVGGEGALLLHNTVTQQQLAKWSDSNVVVYVGCGERGNEMTEVLVTFPELKDPKSGRPLLERTILVANTSNMPVAAREASIYTGITMAEYYRDMGYDVALMADSTSRWAEALREISGRLEEMPGEEGYPAYLGRRLAEFYERSGRVVVLSPEERIGSVTIVGAVSPPGGDFSEPVSQNTLRVTRVFWALDASLAGRRHFPAINWLTSYSLYADDLAGWGRQNVGKDWPEMRAKALEILQKEAELQDIVQLVGYDALPESEKGILDIARMIREDYLQQSAFDEVDTYSSIKKQYEMLKTILQFGDKEAEAIKAGVQASQISALDVKNKISRMKWTPEDKMQELLNEIEQDMKGQFESLIQTVIAT
ncbi:MAG: V-type ATP synthase subunit A [Nitrososphaerota archaeon]